MSDDNGNGGGTTRRLPLWKGCLENMLAEGVNYGKVYNVEWFELQLSCKCDTRQFGLGVYKIRFELEKLGFYLQGHVQREGKLVIIPREKNLGVARAKQRRSRKEQARTVNLLTATTTAGLKPRMRASFEKETKRAIIRQMLIARAGRVAKVIEKAAPKLLEW